MQPPVPKITIGEVAYARHRETGKSYREYWEEVAKEKMKADLLVFGFVLAVLVAIVIFL